MGAVVLGLLSGLSWGVADFLGGLASRRAEPFAVVALSQAAGLVVALAVAAVVRPDLPPPDKALLGAAAGLAGVIGLMAFYRALSVGSMSVVAPISALGAAVPVVVDLLAGEAPAAVVLAGMLIALAGAALVARAPGPASRAGVGLAVVAALGSLYPVTTVALAAALLHERLGRLQAAGAGCALAGVAMIATG